MVIKSEIKNPRSSSLSRRGKPSTPRQTVKFEESNTNSWEQVGMSDTSEQETEISPEEPGSLLNNAQRGWKRMAIKLASYVDAKTASDTMEDIRSDRIEPAVDGLSCSHPREAYIERENQYSKWAKCLACNQRLWTRSLTKEERQGQLRRKAERLARKDARVEMSKEVPFTVPVETNVHRLQKKPPQESQQGGQSASSGSAGTTSGSGQRAEQGQLAIAMQANTEALAKMAEAVQMLAKRRDL